LPEALRPAAPPGSGEKKRETRIFDCARELASLLLFDLAGRVKVSRRTIKEHATQYYKPAAVCSERQNKPKKAGPTMKMKHQKNSGFTLVEIMIVVAIIGLLAAIAIPNFVRARTTSQTNACISNLRIIDGAKGQWALELHMQTTSTPAGTDIQPYMGRGSAGTLPSCPNDSAQAFATSYTPNNCGTKPVCIVMPTTHILP
jgi:prepilin-type N-terminal cleavage/methylation domain-containing protein